MEFDHSIFGYSPALQAAIAKRCAAVRQLHRSSMFSFGQKDRRLLDGLDSATERMVVERWIELTFDHTHPEWRLKGPSDDGKAMVRVLDDLKADRFSRAYHTVAQLAGSCLARGAGPPWQRNAVRTYLLGGSTDTGKDFAERLRDLSPDFWPSCSEGSKVRIQWWSESGVPKHIKLPWDRDPVPSRARGPAEHAIYARVQRREDQRRLLLSTRANGGDPRLLHRAAMQLQMDGGIALDFSRLTSPETPLRMEDHIVIKGSSRLDELRFPEMPRVQSARMRRAASVAYRALRHSPETQELKQAVASLRWLSLALARWDESPVMATALIYIALETAHNGCIARHRPKKECSCRKSQPTALQRYVDQLQNHLAREIEDHLLRERGALKNAAAATRDRHRWLLEGELSRRGRGVKRWANDLLRQMSASEQFEPLRRFHLAELVLLKQQQLDKIERRCRQDLKDLRIARNELVHDTDLLISEQRTSYLAGLAVEMLLLRIEEVNRRYGS